MPCLQTVIIIIPLIQLQILVKRDNYTPILLQPAAMLSCHKTTQLIISIDNRMRKVGMLKNQYNETTYRFQVIPAHEC